ncbi:beta-1,3-glucanase family protein [Streptomyces chartreusis]|uniref:beta-1,3-glucanase family protein n=1 Tax=Streptomyces chartreusis TaxID=1969 RepID=UPI0036DB5539
MVPIDSPVFSRRRALTSLAGTAVAGAALAAGARPALAADGDGGPALPEERAGGLPLVIHNNSGEYANRNVHLYIVGSRGDRQVRVTRRGTVEPVKVSDNKDNGFTDYAIPLATRGTTRIRLPHMSGRIYVSLGGKLKLKAVQDGAGRPALQHPAGWVKNDPNFPVLHDFVEFTHNESGMFCNTTMVDMFSVPLMIRLSGNRDQTTGTMRQGGRARIFRAMENTPGFGKLVVGERRVIAPSHGLDAGRFGKHYFDPYVDKVWQAYRQQPLHVRTVAGAFTGRVDNGKLTFHGPATVSFAKPSTRDVLFCDGALAAPNDGVTGPVGAILGAGFNRSTLLSHPKQPTTRAATFYKPEITNHYARAIHAQMGNGKAYGFAFDDVAEWASYIQDTQPQAMHLTLTPF